MPCAPGFGRQIFHYFIEVFHRVDAEHKRDMVIVPAIQMLGLREIGIIAKADFSKTRLATQSNRTVEPGRGSIVTGAITEAVDDVQRFVGVAQRNHQRMVAPLAFVVNVHSLLAFTGGFDYRSVAVDDGFLKETVRLLFPDLAANRIENFHQHPDRNSIEAVTEVTRRRRVRNPLGTQRVEIGLIVTSEFEMINTRPTSENVVCHVEHMIGLGVRQVDLEQRNVLVDGLVEFQQFHHAMDQSDTAAQDRLLPLGDFITSICCLEFGGLILVGRSCQTFRDSSFAYFQLVSYLFLHSKTLRGV